MPAPLPGPLYSICFLFTTLEGGGRGKLRTWILKSRIRSNSCSKGVAWAQRGGRGGGEGAARTRFVCFFCTLEIPKPKRYRPESRTFPSRASSKTWTGTAQRNQKQSINRTFFLGMAFFKCLSVSTASH